MKIYEEITVDLTNPYPLPKMKAQQGNTGRGAKIKLTHRRATIQIDKEIVNLYAKLPNSMNMVYLSTKLEDGLIVADFSNVMLSKVGNVQVELQIIENEQEGATQITTPIFIVEVKPSNIDEGKIVASSEFSALVDALADVQEYKANGLKGDKGDSATINVGTVETLEPNQNAVVTNSGTVHDAILNFGIPKGEKGLQGEKGDKGDSATIQVGTVETLEPNQKLTVENVGTVHDAVFNFGIPKGEKGESDYKPAVDALEKRLDNLKKDLSNLPVDYVSRASVSEQNLLDVTVLNDGYIDTSNGTIRSGSQYGCDKYTNLIVAKPSTTYYRSYSNVFLYDANGGFIERAGGAPSSKSFETTEETAYIRMSLRSTVDDMAKAFLSSEKKVYYPYKYKFEGMTVNVENIEGLSKANSKLGILTLRDSAKLPIIDCTNKQITFYMGTVVTVGQSRYVIEEDVVLSLTVGTVSIKYVVFDTTTKTLKLVNSNGEASISDTCYIVMTVSFGDTNFISVKSVFCTCNYSIVGADGTVEDRITVLEENDVVFDGRITALEEKGGNGGNTYYYPTVIKDWYTPYGEEFDKFTIWSNPPEGTSYTKTVVADYISAFDELVSVYPNYVTKTQVGTDATGTYPIYQYDFKPLLPETQTGKEENKNPKKFPKVLITGGMHGDEKNSPFGIYFLVRDILNHWDENDLLEYLRFNVHLVIIPVLNPYGFDNPSTQQGSRYNGNHVNINRNFDYNWESMDSDATSTNYRGASPASEAETQIVINMVENNLDAIYYVDYHTNGSSGTDPLYTMWHIYPVSKMLYNLQGTSEYHLAKMSRVVKSSYGQSEENDFYGYTSFSDTACVYNWATANGMPCTTLECPRKFITETVYNSAEVNKFSAELLGNWLGMVLMQYAK